MSRKRRKNADIRIGKSLSRVLLAISAYFVLFALLSAAITPDRYDIQVGMPAPNAIKATKDVEDSITTERLKSEAAGAVRRVFSEAEDVSGKVIKNATDRMAKIKELSSLYSTPDGESAAVTDEQLTGANAHIAPVTIDSSQLSALGSHDDETLTRLSEATILLLTEAMTGNVQDSQIADVVAEIEKTLVADGFDASLASISANMLDVTVEPNYFYDEAATEAARQAERDKVETVTRIKGEVIVSDGELVTEAQYEMLDSLGMIKESTMDISLYYGVALLVAILMAAVVMYIALFEPEIGGRLKTLCLLALISVVVVGASLLARDLNPYLMPSALGVLLIAQLINRRLALIVNIVLAVITSLFASASTGFFNMAMFTIVVNTMVSGPVALLVLKKRWQRTTTLLAGVCIGVCNMISTFAVGLINNASLMNVLVMAEWSALSGVLAAILCIAFMPLLEWMFNLVTPSKLIELSNPNQPLLRRLLLEAPGTYHHSIIVANLAEAAAGTVGANGLLARVGAYYHDVGKLKRPSYFKENQMGDNPHDRTDPRVSTAILISHTRDGVQMAQKERIPEPIIDIIRSHHGDTPVMYFYNKSAKENDGDANIDDFRYDGPRPKTREAAIVMLADTVEAAARSIQNPDSDKLDSLIRSLVRQKLDDGQLDECDLTFSDLNTICKSFLTVLSGVFHERIEYPSLEIPKKQLAGNAQAAQ